MKITPREPGKGRETVRVKTRMKDLPGQLPSDWWNSGSKRELAQKLLSTVTFLKEVNSNEFRQAAVYARLYGNLPLFGWAGSNISKIASPSTLPSDRPTMSVVTSAIDTIVSRLSLAKPRPLFLTDNGDYRQRNLGKQLNQFIAGELYQTKAYELGAMALRDAGVLGTGVIKILKDSDDKVALERRLKIELLVDHNDSYYGDPRQLYELKLVDREVLMNQYPKWASMIERAEQAYPDSSNDAAKTVSDLIMIAEGFRLPSSSQSHDGLHAIACSEGVFFDEEWKKKTFPYSFLHYAPRQIGFWGQGLIERQMGKQIAVNQLLIQIHDAIRLVGVPRVFVEEGSKVSGAHFNNNIGTIIKYRGIKPIYEVAQCVPQELYAQLERLVQSIYQDEGISFLAATSQKPAGLDSGEAIRNYDDIQSDRFAALNRRYNDFYIDLAYKMLDQSCEIAEETGSYQTIYPNKDGTKEIDLPEAKKLKENPFVIQCFDSSSLPREPAGRLQRITEMIQSGMYTPQEGRRLMGYPDTEQVDKLQNASEERILKILDDIVEHGKYLPPDQFMDLSVASMLVTQYYNLYSAAKLEPERVDMLLDFFAQIQAIQQEAMAPPPQPGVSAPQALPQPLPQSPMIPNVPAGQP